MAGISGGFLVLGILPMGWLADRYRRPPIIGWATVVFGLMVAATGFAINIFVFFLARFGAGISQSSTNSVHGSLLADTYPINVRGRLYAAMGMGSGAGHGRSARCWWDSSPPRSVAPTAGAGPSTSWPSRSCWSLSSPSASPSRPEGSSRRRTCWATSSGTRLRPRRRSRPPSSGSCVSAPSRPCLIAFSAIGFGLFTGPVLGNLYLKQRFGLDAFQRGMIGTIGSVGVLVALPLVGRYYDRLYRKDPARALSLIGKVVLPVAVIVPIQYFMPNAVLWAVFSVPSGVLLLTGFSMIGPVLTSVAPYRLRGMVGAVGGIYVFFIGATGGAVLAALLDSVVGHPGHGPDHHDPLDDLRRPS